MLFFSQRNYMRRIPPGLAKVYPLHPNDAANYSTQNMQSRSKPLKPTFHLLLTQETHWAAPQTYGCSGFEKRLGKIIAAQDSL